jgi:hypothetical protein
MHGQSLLLTFCVTPKPFKFVSISKILPAGYRPCFTLALCGSRPGERLAAGDEPNFVFFEVDHAGLSCKSLADELNALIIL